MKKIFFTVGPTQKSQYFDKYLSKAIRLSIPSISHRSEDFHNIYAELDTNLKSLWKIPTDYKILFFSSATEIWDRLAQNCVQEESLHFVTGSFGQKHANAIMSYHKKVKVIEKDFIDKDQISEILTSRKKSYEYIAFTHNESSNGIKTPESVIHFAKKISPTSLVIVDAVSSAPLPKFNFEMVDGVYFSVQKCFGLPAGLGVLIASPALIEKSIKVKNNKNITGYHKSFDAMIKSYEKWETVETPNVLNIYLLDEVVKDFIKQQISEIRKINKTNKLRIIEFMSYKFAVLPHVKTTSSQSDTVLVFESGDKTEQIKKYFAKRGIIVGSGYGDKKKTQIRIANFPQHSAFINKVFEIRSLRHKDHT